MTVRRQRASLRAYSTKELRRRPGRTLLTIFGIAIGIGTMVAITASIDTTRSVYRDMYQRLSGRAALEIVSPGFGTFDRGQVPLLDDVSGLHAAVPVLQGPVAAPTPEGAGFVICLGIDLELDRFARDLRLERGRFLADGDEILVGRDYADERDLDLGDRLVLVTAKGLVTFELVGVLAVEGAAAYQGGTTVFVPLAAAQELMGATGRLSALQLVLDDGVSKEEVRAAIEGRLPPGLEVGVPAARATFSRSTLDGLEQGLGVMSVVSLVAGAFVVLNTFLMNLSERRRRFAILRSIGATRRQVARLLIREAVVLGTIGTVVGLACGWFLATVVTLAMEPLLGIEIPALAWSPWVLVMAGVCGPGLTVLATLIPIRRAARRDVLTDLFPGAASQREVVGRGPILLGAILMATALGLQAVFLTVPLDKPTITILVPLATVALLVGCVLIVPLFVRPLGQWVGFVLRPLVGPEGWLAFRHLDRYRMRTSLTVGVLFMAITISIGVGNAILSSIDDLGDWFRSTIDFDVFVRGSMPDPGTMQAPSIPESIRGELLAVEGVASAEALNFAPARGEGHAFILLARTVEPAKRFSLDVDESGRSAEEIRDGLLAGGIALGAVLAHRIGCEVGDSFLLDTPSGPRSLPVVGIFTAYTLGGMAACVERGLAQQLLGFEGAHVFLVRLESDRREAAAAEIRTLCEARQLMFQTNRELRAFVDTLLDGVLGLFWLLLVLVFVVSSLGTVNTLVMNVLEQTREFGVLRTIAMKQSQVVRMVLAQALGMVGIAVVPGLALGVLIAYLMHLDMVPLTGFSVPFVLHWGLLAAVVAGASVVTLVAALFPARRAARIEIIEALQYE